MKTLVHRNAPYHCVRCDRHRHGGGVALFISDLLESHVILCIANQLELLLVSVHNTHHPNHKLYIGVWYRPPDSSDALDSLHSVLEILDISIFSRFLLVGDFNVDLSNKQHPLSYKLLTSFFTDRDGTWSNTCIPVP